MQSLFAAGTHYLHSFSSSFSAEGVSLAAVLQECMKKWTGDLSEIETFMLPISEISATCVPPQGHPRPPIVNILGVLSCKVYIIIKNASNFGFTACQIFVKCEMVLVTNIQSLKNENCVTLRKFHQKLEDDLWTPTLDM